MRQTFKDVGLNIVCICLITILIFLITRWAPIQSNNMEGGVTIAIFLITSSPDEDQLGGTPALWSPAGLVFVRG